MLPLFAVGDACRLPLPDRSVDLVFGSPPYCDARTYGIKADRRAREWVEWMLKVSDECLRVSKGAVVWVVGGVTRKRNYWPACEGLAWEWHCRGGSSYRPCIFHRVGVPGSGGDDWFRSDTEFILCFKRPGKLPWSDNTAMGHPPKWAPGGEMSHRVTDGTRRNQWGGGVKSGGARDKDGKISEARVRPSHRVHTKREDNGEMREQYCCPPAIANPGNLISLKVGGGLMGHKLAHDNEAPFPEGLAEWFIRSLCPPGGIILDPFSGSGTTACVAQKLGRYGIGIDLRESQAKIGVKRSVGAQLLLPVA
jgi:hypothetical protein